MGLLKKKNSQPESSAAISDDCLIVSLPQAIEPTVWRLELDKAKNASFEIQSDEEKFSLVIKKSARSKPDPIGQFETKEDALDALLMVSEALKAGGGKKPVTTAKKKDKPISEEPLKPKSSNNNGGTIALIATLIVIGLFYYYWAKLMPTVDQIQTQEITSSILNSNPQSQTGVPVSADDFLKGF